LKTLIKLRKSQDFDAGWYGRSIHVSDRGEWNFDLNKKPIDRVRLHGSFFSAVHTVQQDLIKGRISIKCPILFMCSNRSIKPDKTWRDEYAEGIIILFIVYQSHEQAEHLAKGEKADPGICFFPLAGSSGIHRDRTSRVR
jgi:hypothetical protein